MKKRAAVISAAIGLAVALAGVGLEALIEGNELISVSAIDNLVIGVLVALAVFWYEQRRYRALSEGVRTIVAMNHHVRNALQILTYSAYVQQPEEQMRMIADAVKRIEWALQEILPKEMGR